MSDTLTESHVVEAVAEANGYSRKKSIETVEIMSYLFEIYADSRYWQDLCFIHYPACIISSVLNFLVVKINKFTEKIAVIY